MYESEGLLSQAVFDAHFSIWPKYPFKIPGAKLVMNDLEKSTSSGVVFFAFAVGLPYLFIVSLKELRGYIRQHLPHEEPVQVGIGPFFRLEPMVPFSLI